MRLMRVFLLASLFALGIAGCSSKGGVEGEDATAAGADGAYAGAAGKNGRGPQVRPYGQGADRGTYGGQGYGRDGAGGSGSAELDDPTGPLAKRVVYFMYDSYEVMPEYQSVVNAHANFLAAHPDQRAVLEGHADERGSPEYNIALGEQRAKAVQRMMQVQGVGGGQMQVVSFGEEKPAAEGHDDASWQQNRRVEIAYPGH